MTTEAQQFEPVYRSRPGADAMRPAAAERAEQIAPGLWCSPGLSNAYLLVVPMLRRMGRLPEYVPRSIRMPLS